MAKTSKVKVSAAVTAAPEGKIAARYKRLETFRDPFLARAREAAKYTIPSLMPPLGFTTTTLLPTPFQSIGARGVNNLASKLLLALFPPNSPFFRLKIEADKFTAQQAANPDFMAEIDQGLSKIEAKVVDEIEDTTMRPGLFEALKQDLVAGNVLIHYPQEGGNKVFRLDSYVCTRDGIGNVLEIITKECMDPRGLPKVVQAEIAAALEQPPEDDDTILEDVDVYTCTKLSRDGKLYETSQEIKGVSIIATKSSVPVDKPAWIALRFIKEDGEDYGRGFVEEYIGDLKSAEGIRKATVEGAAAMAKFLLLVKPNGTTKAKTIAEAPNGAVREGNAEDVTVLQANKSADLTFAANVGKEIMEDLKYAFMLNSAIQRNGERVTAEEIRYMANELDSALGGVYSLLSQTLQRPTVNRIMANLTRQKKIPKMPQGVLKVAIVTGIDALGRGQDLNKLDSFLGGLGQTFGPDVIPRYINVSNYMMRRGTALGLDTTGLVKTEDQIAQADQAAQQAHTMSTLGPNVVNAMGKTAAERVKKEPPPEPQTPQTPPTPAAPVH